jgi:cytochrome b pre-mRNA-processing protein 3
MTLFQRLFGRTADPRDAYRPLYAAIVAAGRAPVWYHDGAPDTVDGRFDMIAAILSTVLVRLEDAPEAKQPSVHVAELFIDDMDGQLRQIGIGDVTVGKHIGKMMGALGGRLTAYRDAGGDVVRLRHALVRNLWRAVDPGAAADAVATRLAVFTAAVRVMPVAEILAGALPPVPEALVQ